MANRPPGMGPTMAIGGGPSSTAGPSSQPTLQHIQLDHWANALAPLSDAQKASVNRLSDLVSPRHQRRSVVGRSKSQGAAARESPRTATHLLAPSHAGPSQAPISPNSPAAAAAGINYDSTPALALAAPSLPHGSLSDAPSFVSWFAQVSSHMASSTRWKHDRALHELTAAANEADDLLDQLEAARVNVAELRAGVKFVHEGSQGLREEAEAMVEKLDHISSLSEALSLRLSYFSILPGATSFLSSPSLSLVLSPDFLHTLDRLDLGLAFLAAHPHYKDAALYKMRFEHCLVRAGQLVRLWTIARWKEMGGECTGKMKEWEKNRFAAGRDEKAKAVDDEELMELSDPVLGTLLISRFEDEAPSFRPLLAELERRSAPSAPAAASLAMAEEEAAEAYHDEASLLADYSRAEVEDEDEGDEEDGKQQESDDAATAEEPISVFSSPEFDSLLSECRASYVEMRRALMQGLVSSCIARIEVQAQTEARSSTDAAAAAMAARPAKPPAPTDSPLVHFVRRAARFILAVAEKEGQLFAAYFDVSRGNKVAGAAAREGSREALQSYLRSLAASLYDRLRPRLQRETNLAVLSEVCRVLLVLTEECSAPSSAPRVGDAQAAEQPRDLPSSDASFVGLCVLSPLLREAIACLVARSGLLIEGPELKAYQPKEADVDYPSRLGDERHREENKHRRAKSSVGGAGLLEAAAEIQLALDAAGQSSAGKKEEQEEEEETFSPRIKLFNPPPIAVLRTWYPTVPRTLTLLGLLYDRIPTPDFIRLAPSAMEACRVSLHVGADKMKNEKGAGASTISARIDGHLFLVRHLIILREMAASVELAARGKEEEGGGRATVGRADRALALLDGREGSEAGKTGHGTAGADGGRAGGGVDLKALVDAVNSIWKGGSSWLDPRNLYGFARRGSGGAGAAAAASRSSLDISTRGVARGGEGEAERLPASGPLGATIEKLEEDLSSSTSGMMELVVQSVILPLRIYRDQTAGAGGAGGKGRRSLGGPALASPPLNNANAEGPTSPLDPAKRAAEESRAKGAAEAFKTCANSNLVDARDAIRRYIEDEGNVARFCAPIAERIETHYARFQTSVAELLAGADAPSPIDIVMPTEEVRALLRRLLNLSEGEGGEAQ